MDRPDVMVFWGGVGRPDVMVFWGGVGRPDVSSMMRLPKVVRVAVVWPTSLTGTLYV